MDYEIFSHDIYTIILLKSSRFDASTSEEFKSELFEIIDKGKVNIVIDLTNIRFMDSRGLGVLVAGLKKVSNNGQFILIGAQPAIEDLFDLTSMDKVFQIYKTVDEVVSKKIKYD